MRRVFFELERFKEPPRRFKAEIDEVIGFDEIKRRINNLALGAWNFIFVAPHYANWISGDFREIALPELEAMKGEEKWTKT